MAGEAPSYGIPALTAAKFISVPVGHMLRADEQGLGVYLD